MKEGKRETGRRDWSWVAGLGEKDIGRQAVNSMVEIAKTKVFSWTVCDLQLFPEHIEGMAMLNWTKLKWIRILTSFEEEMRL